MEISQNVVALLKYLLPGFVAAWVFYGLTAHPKPSPFERTVQALIFTVIISVIVDAISWLFAGIACMCGFSFGTWAANVELTWAILIAMILGHAVSWGANTNWYHKRLYRFRFTTKTSLVSEWHSAFSMRDCYVILHLADDLGQRQLLGWPNEWPDDPENGHFAMTDAEWLVRKEGRYERQAAEDDEMILIPASAVKMVEFVRSNEGQESQEGNA